MTKDQTALLLENQLLQTFIPFEMLLMEGNFFGPSGALYSEAFERIFTLPAIISLPNSHGQRDNAVVFHSVVHVL